jgi:hypothetical protein
VVAGWTAPGTKPGKVAAWTCLELTGVAHAAGLTIVPCLTKLDLKTSDPAASLAQMETMLGIAEEEVIWSSAKTFEGVDAILDAVVARVPPPRSAARDAPAHGLVCDMCRCAGLGGGGGRDSCFAGGRARPVPRRRVPRGRLRRDLVRVLSPLPASRLAGLTASWPRKPADKVKVLGQADAEFEVKEVGVFLPSWCPIPGAFALALRWAAWVERGRADAWLAAGGLLPGRVGAGSGSGVLAAHGARGANRSDTCWP